MVAIANILSGNHLIWVKIIILEWNKIAVSGKPPIWVEIIRFEWKINYFEWKKRPIYYSCIRVLEKFILIKMPDPGGCLVRSPDHFPEDHFFFFKFCHRLPQRQFLIFGLFWCMTLFGNWLYETWNNWLYAHFTRNFGYFVRKKVVFTGVIFGNFI